MGVHESRLAAALVELDMDQGAFAVLSGINRTKLSQCLRGREEFTGPEQIRLAALVEELRSLARDAAPLKLSFRDINAIRLLLEYRRTGIKWAATAIESPEERDQQDQYQWR
jgi:hypothetical protein